MQQNSVGARISTSFAQLTRISFTFSIDNVFPVPGQPQTYKLPAFSCLMQLLQKSKIMFCSRSRHKTVLGAVDTCIASLTALNCSISARNQIANKINQCKKEEKKNLMALTIYEPHVDIVIKCQFLTKTYLLAPKSVFPQNSQMIFLHAAIYSSNSWRISCIFQLPIVKVTIHCSYINQVHRHILKMNIQ